jgi:predicted NBD/HSP70 family sugar kinase
MAVASRSQHAYLAKINERHVLEVVRDQGPASRADIVRQTGLSAPTVSKAAASLQKARLLEEGDAEGPAIGRPAMKLRLATSSAQVLGVVIDVKHCWTLASGLDGQLHDKRARRVDTPGNYHDLIDLLVKNARELMAKPGVMTLGVGVTVPGLVDHQNNLGVLSPNLHSLEGHSPGRDLSERLGIDCVMMQDQHALCAAERYHGMAKGLDDFVYLDVSSGVGLGVMSGGRILLGHSGFAGEIGHITIEPRGRRCGCGNLGCLETVASDAALAWRVSRRLGRTVDIDEVIRVARAGKLNLEKEFNEVVGYLAIALATVINIFNPATLFVHGQLFDADGSLFARVLERTEKRALGPSFADCQIIRARGSKRQGAVAGVIQHLIDAVVPVRGGSDAAPRHPRALSLAVNSPH